MCSNYHPATADKLRFHFGAALPDSGDKEESYPGYMAPINRLPRVDAVAGERACALDPDQYEERLHCPVEEAPGFFMRYAEGRMVARAVPKPPRGIV
jgi:hypothetical protein